MEHIDRTCTSCGRRMEARRSDRGVQPGTERKYCSAACRKRKVKPIDRGLESSIQELLSQRAEGASICPSEAAKAVSLRDEGPGHGDWASLMEPARCAARRLAAAGAVEITQKSQVVDPSTAKGPIRIRVAPAVRPGD